MPNVISLSEYRDFTCIDVFREKLKFPDGFFSNQIFLDFISKYGFQEDEIKGLNNQEIEEKLNEVLEADIDDLIKLFGLKENELIVQKKGFYEGFNIKGENFNPKLDLGLYIIEGYLKHLGLNISGQIIDFPLSIETETAISGTKISVDVLIGEYKKRLNKNDLPKELVKSFK